MSLPTLLEANLEALAARLPDLALLIKEAALDRPGAEGPRLELIPSPRGRPSARLGGLLLHSAYNPEQEAARIADSLPPATDTALLLGFGLGYLAEALLGLGPGGGGSRVERVLVCEAEPGLLSACLSARDLRELLSSERLGFLVGGPAEGLVVALDEMGARSPALLPLPPLVAAYPDWYAGIRAAAERFAAKETINENTLRRFGPLWVRNLARNLHLIGSLPGTARLEGAFSGLPALVVAAGPSLDELLPSLPELRERFLIVCVDTALRSLLRSGIEPDFLLVVDPQYWNWRHLEGLSSPSSILVSESAAWPPVFRFSCRAAFLCGSLFPLGKAIEAAVGPKGLLGAGGSVATTAWDFARVLGASVIYMAGLDLAFPGGATHAKASLFEQRALSAGRRLAPAETSQTAALFSGGASWGLANDGGQARTDKRMLLYAWWFESRLARPGSPITKSLSPRGLAIPGMGRARLGELLAAAPRRSEIDARLDLAAATREEAGARERVSTGLEALLCELRLARTTALRASREAARARAELGSGRHPREALALLDGLDADLLSGGARDIIGFLLPPLADLIGARARDLAESLERSEWLYGQVAASASYHLDFLEK
jgi:hypothetical protein